MRLPQLREGRPGRGQSCCANCIAVGGLARARWTDGRRFWLCRMCRVFVALRLTPDVEGPPTRIAARRRRCPTMDEQEQQLRGTGIRSGHLEWAEAAREQRARATGRARGWTVRGGAP